MTVRRRNAHRGPHPDRPPTDGSFPLAKGPSRPRRFGARRMLSATCALSPGTLGSDLLQVLVRVALRAEALPHPLNKVRVPELHAAPGTLSCK